MVSMVACLFLSVNEVLMSEKHSRNEPCPCGSGKKYKKCCGKKQQLQKQMGFELFKGHGSMSMDAAAKALKDRVFKAMPDMVYGIGKAISTLVESEQKKDDSVAAPQQEGDKPLEQ